MYVILLIFSILTHDKVLFDVPLNFYYLALNYQYVELNESVDWATPHAGNGWFILETKEKTLLCYYTNEAREEGLRMVSHRWPLPWFYHTLKKKFEHPHYSIIIECEERVPIYAITAGIVQEGENCLILNGKDGRRYIYTPFPLIIIKNKRVQKGDVLGYTSKNHLQITVKEGEKYIDPLTVINVYVPSWVPIY